MNEITLLSEYTAWLIRNSYKEAGLTGNKFDCDVFRLLVNPFSISDLKVDFPDSIAGLEVLVDVCNSEFLIRLSFRPEDRSKNLDRFLKAFYELQMVFDFDNETWRNECGLIKNKPDYGDLLSSSR